ncbi:MAG: hypothetical protein ABWX68_10070 [Arthrobacter sp.]|uniref:hypothetical protein n=1 Tax=Arthrobacter sp. TaxID=1667 RepID=UPI00349A3E0A
MTIPAAPHRAPAYAGRFRPVPTDLGRVVGALAVPAGWAVGGPVPASVMLLALGGLWALRYYARTPLEDAVGQAVILSAAWFSAIGAYATVPGLDLAAHFAAPLVLTRLAWNMMVVHRLVHPTPAGHPRLRAGAAIAAASLGTLLGVLWEIGEWAGHEFLTRDIGVGYRDTIGDLAATLLGASAGAVLATRPRRVPVSDSPVSDSSLPGSPASGSPTPRSAP